MHPLLDLQPGIISNNRLGGGYQGDTETPEQRIPPNGYPDRDWETCMTINETWGYKSTDTDFKSTETLLRNLIDIASKGGNYLLNVGPTSEGVIPQPEVERIQAIGKWLQVNGEAIYNTHATPFGPEAGEYSATEKDKNGKPKFVAKWDWRCTSKTGVLYIHVLKWPDGKLELPKISGTISKVSLLADPQHTALEFSQQADGVTITLPQNAPDPIASVVKIELTSGI